MNHHYRAQLAYLLGITIASFSVRAECAPSFDVCDYGAKGDGNTLDTIPLNKAIEACGVAGGGRVLIPPGRYLTGTVRLKSNVTILLEAGAELVGTPDLDQYQHFTPPEDTPLVGGSLRWHRALILGEGVENVTITGRGIINGNNVVDVQGEEGVRGPHAVLFGNCKNITLRDISIRDAANYAVFFEFTNNVEVRGVKITGGYDGVHFRGWKDDPCRDVSITDCEFYTGDDCIAGWHWQDTLIDRCVLNSASNGIRLFGPAKHVVVHNCLFFGPGRYAWRTLGLASRKNMTSGLCIQPSAWGATEGIVDDVQVSDVVMRDVGTPLHLVAVSPSTIGRITIDRLSATGIYRAAASIESWVAEPIARVDIRDSNLNFVGGFGPVWSDPAEAAVSYLTKQSDQVGPPGMNPRPLPAWGIYARHVTSLNLSDVRIEVDNDDDRPAIIMDGVESLTLDDFTWPEKTRRPMVLKNLRRIAQSGLTIPVVEAECLSLAASSDCKIVTATVQCNQSGLAKIELKLDKRTVTRWTWLLADEKVDVIFADLPKPDGQQWREIVCGSIRADIESFRSA